MRKLGVLALVLMVSFALPACTSSTQIGLVNPSRLFQDSASGKAGIEHLKQMESSMQEQLLAAQKLIEKKPGDETLRVRVQQEFAGYQQLVNNEQQKVVEGINSQIKSSLENVRIQKKLDAIFSSETVLDFDAKLDVTGDVLTEMNRMPLTFAPAPITPIETVLKQAEKPAEKAADKK